MQISQKNKAERVVHARADDFGTVTVNTYGENKRLAVLCLDLVWPAIQEKLRFVLIMTATARSF